MQVTQHHLESLLPCNKNWFTPKEVAHVLNRSDQFVRACLESGQLLGHSFPSCGGRRKSHQVPRDCLLLFMIQSANYEPVDLLEQMLQVVRKLSPDQRRLILHALDPKMSRAV